MSDQYEQMRAQAVEQLERRLSLGRYTGRGLGVTSPGYEMALLALSNLLLVEELRLLKLGEQP